MPHPTKSTIHVIARKGIPHWYIQYWCPPDDKHPEPWRRRIATSYDRTRYTREDVLEIMNRAHDSATSGNPGCLTIGRMRDEVLRRLEIDDRPAMTVNQYHNSFAWLISLRGESYDVTLLKPSIIYDLKEYGITRHMSHATITTRIRYLRAAFNTLIRDRILEDNPFKDFARHKSKSPDLERKQHLSLPELKAFIAFLDDYHIEPLRHLLRISIYTGLRRNEVLYIERDGIVFYPVTSPGQPAGVLRAMNVKRRHQPQRWIPMHQAIADDIRWFLDRNPHSDHPLAYYHPSSYTHMAKNALRRAGYPELNLHSLRHTFGTRAIEEGMSLRDLQRHLDHSDMRITEIYAHDIPQIDNQPSLGI